jgi:5-methylcytosine-specific restriction endonuclease McrA
MVSAPQRLCTCGNYYPSSQGCPTCAKRRHRNPVHGSRKWRETSKANLARHPLCAGYPLGYHGTTPVLAQCMDHILSLEQRPDLAFESSNHRSLCFDCNKRKGIAQEGGFGRP